MNGNEELTDSTSVSKPPDDVPNSSDQPMDEEILVCPICAKRFELPTTYHTHLRLSHRISKRGEKLPPLKKPGKDEKEKKADEKEKEKKEKPTHYPCPQCKWVFSREPNLRRHMINMHPSDNQERFKCGHCDFETTYLYYLKRHIQRHSVEESKLQCAYCELKFNDHERLEIHEKNKHKNGNKKTFNYYKKCPKCSFVSTKKPRDEINAHFRNAHNIELTWQSLTFDSASAFAKWKSDLEKSMSVQYKCRINLSYYACNRSGTKFDGYCPSAISVRMKDDGSVFVRYMPNHVGHETNYTYRKSFKEQKQKIGHQSQSNSTLKSDEEDYLESEDDGDTLGSRDEDTLGSRDEDALGSRDEDALGSRDEDALGSRDEDALGSRDEDALASNALVAQQADLIEDGVVFDEANETRANQQCNLLQDVGFRDKLQKFVDYCQTGAKSREQLAYLEMVMEQAMYNAESMRSVSHS